MRTSAQVTSDKEESRKYRRNVFQPNDWVKHRSSDRYQRHITSMFTSGNVTSLLGPTLAVSGWSSVEGVQSVGGGPRLNLFSVHQTSSDSDADSSSPPSIPPVHLGCYYAALTVLFIDFKSPLNLYCIVQRSPSCWS